MANFVGVRCGRAWAATWLACVVTGCGSNGDAEPDASSSDTGANADSSASGDESGEACVADCKPGGTVLWETHVGGPGEDGAFALAFDAEGRIAVVGAANVTTDPFEGTQTWNGLVALLEADGSLAFLDMAAPRTMGVGLASDASVVVTGLYGQSLFLRRYDASGTILWDSADAAARDADGGVVAVLPNDEIVVGGGTPTAGLIARYGADGTERTFTELPVNIFVSDLVAVGDDIVATGPDYQSIFWVGKTDLDGAVQWSATGSGQRWIATAAADNGNVIVAAETFSGSTQLYIYDSAGKPVTTVPVPRADALVLDIAVLPNGDTLLAGVTLGQCWYARMDSLTTFAWQSDLTLDPGASECYSIDVAHDGTVLVSGKHDGPMGSPDAWIRRVAP